MKDVRGIAAWLGATEGKVRSAVERGMLPYHKWGGRVIFLVDELELYFKRLPGLSVDEAIANIRLLHDDAQ